MWILWLALLALIIWLVVRGSAAGESARQDTPEQIVKRRYARGEITGEEYERILNDLRR